jgi:hypothetical protein
MVAPPPRELGAVDTAGVDGAYQLGPASPRRSSVNTIAAEQLTQNIQLGHTTRHSLLRDIRCIED